MPVDSLISKALGQDATQLAVAEKRTLLSRLLARMAHEVRNPLSSLDIHVQLLQEDLAQLDSAVREKVTGRLDVIRGELQRLDRIVEDFLRLTGP
jgi:two-component system sensor histidine kinase HydH